MTSTIDTGQGDGSVLAMGQARFPLRPGDLLADAWRDFLGEFPWEWFCTLTFRDSVHPEAAFKTFRYWIALLNAEEWGRRWRRRTDARGGVHWVCALEWQKRGVLHFHALVGADRAVQGARQDVLYRHDRRRWAQKWDDLAGFARIDLIEDCEQAVHGYVSKYVAKGGQIELSANVESRGRAVSTRLALS